jgi:polyisoprenoid-binding protein YceI
MATIEPSSGTEGLFAGAAGTWLLDPSATTIELRTKAMWGLAKVKGSFKAVEGEGVVTADGGLSGTLVIDASSVNTGNKKRDVHLRSADFFESDKYPTFTYTATGASPTGEDKVNVTGTLSVHGQTRPLDITANVVQADDRSATLTAEVEIDRSTWGLTWAKMGARMINQLVVSSRFTRA